MDALLKQQTNSGLRPSSSEGVIKSDGLRYSKYKDSPANTLMSTNNSAGIGSNGVISASSLALLSASCSALPVGTVTTDKTKSLFEASGGAFGLTDLKKQQEEIDFQQALLRLPWHKRVSLLKEKQDAEALIQAKQQLRKQEALIASSQNEVSLSKVTRDLTLPLLSNINAEQLLPDLSDAKKSELHAIRNQIAVILAEKIGPKVSSCCTIIRILYYHIHNLHFT